MFHFVVLKSGKTLYFLWITFHWKCTLEKYVLCGKRIINVVRCSRIECSKLSRMPRLGTRHKMCKITTCRLLSCIMGNGGKTFKLNRKCLWLQFTSFFLLAVEFFFSVFDLQKVVAFFFLRSFGVFFRRTTEFSSVRYLRCLKFTAPWF